ncbi:MAG: tetraacyldisaccharide 4'-kinase [Bacteroidales bacterium]|nr:tetraacyldisaccharide 4'-kinase [Bacteroidales bacterium]
MHLRKKYGCLLLPLSWLYCLLVDLRHFLYNIGFFKTHEFNIPIICVGNITVGGTGKTPHVEFIVNLLKEHFKVAILSRGYKRKTKGYREVFIDSTTDEVGDEPLQLKRKFPDVTVVVCEKRAFAIKKLQSNKEYPVNVIVMDDGFQHLSVQAGINILLIDYNNPINKDKLLPYGNLRERIAYIKKANIVIITNTPENIKPIERRILLKNLNLYSFQKVFFSKVKYKKPVVLFEDHTNILKYNFTKNKYYVIILTAIANPEPFVEYVKTSFAENYILLKYPDHYYFKQKDLEFLLKKFNSIPEKNKIIVTTEKDGIRLKESSSAHLIIDLPVFYIPIEIEILFNQEEEFNKQLINYVRKNQAIDRIY